MSDNPRQLPHPYSNEWAPYIDPATGQPVTLTETELNAVMHAVNVVEEVRRSPRGSAGNAPPLLNDLPGKSRALGRLLIQGKPLFEDCPPHFSGAADYEKWDQENADFSDDGQ